MAVIMTIIAMFAGAMHAPTAGAQETQRYALATQRFQDNTVMMWLDQNQPVVKEDGTVVYCYNQQRRYPWDNIAWWLDGGFTATKTIATGETFERSADLPLSQTHPELLGGKSLEINVLEVLETGYPTDVLGLQEHYGLSDHQFYRATQRAIWYYTDSDLRTELSSDYTPQMRAVYNILIQSDQAEYQRARIPAELALEMYVSADPTLQNLLSITRVDRNTGGEIDIFVPEEEQVPGPSQGEGTVDPRNGSIGDFVWVDANNNGIQDFDEVGLGGVTVTAKDVSGNVVARTETAADGSYLFEGLAEGTYTIEFELPEGYGMTLTRAGDNPSIDSNGLVSTVTIGASASNMDVDLGVVTFAPAKATIGDFVWVDANNNGIQDFGETGLGGVTVILRNVSGSEVARTQTNGDGHYSFTDVEPGTYSVEFVVPDGYGVTISRAGTDRTIDSNGLESIVTVTGGQSNTTIDLGLIELSGQPATIGDYVWVDTNANGIQDSNEVGMGSVRVELYDATGTLVSSTTTDDGGYYRFVDVAPGTYTVKFVLPDGYGVTSSRQGDDRERDSDGQAVHVTVSGGEKNFSIDLGLIEMAAKTVIIGDYVWEDTNENGIQDSGEPGLHGVTVTLKNANGAVIRTTETNAQGRYTFTGLEAGTYTIEFTQPENYRVTATGQGGDAARDSNGLTSTVVLEAGVDDLSIDLGLVVDLDDYITPGGGEPEDRPEGGPFTAEGSSYLARCVETTSSVTSPLAWLIPLGLLVAVGGALGGVFGPQINAIVGQVNAQLGQNLPDFGTGGSSVDKPEWVAEIEGQIAAINQQLGQINPALGPALVGATLIAIGIGATEAVWNICGAQGHLGSSGSSGSSEGDSGEAGATGGSGSAATDGGSATGSSTEAPDKN